MALISNGSTIFDNGSMASGFGGSMVFIKKLTASASATLSFVDGTDGVVLDDTYKEYYFTFNNIHPSNNATRLKFNLSSDTGSTYAVAKTTTFFQAYHNESGADSGLAYTGGTDEAQDTGTAFLGGDISSDNDASMSGYFHLFNPSSTTFVKHFINRCQTSTGAYATDHYKGGYANTTSAVDAIQFSMSTGNIDAGDICLYGIA